MKKILLATIGAALFLTSCEDEPKINISYEKALMDKHWILTDVKVNSNVKVPTNTWTSTFGSIPPCVKDNKWYFPSTSDLSVFEHWTKCSPSDPDLRSLFYNIQNENYIKIYSNKANVDGSIVVKGDFKLVDIKTFTIDERKDVSSTFTTSTIYTYSKEE